MKRLLWIFLLLAGGLPLFAQTPDCVVAFTFNAAAQRSTITGCGHNTQGVYEWRAVYASTGFTVLSLRIESSLNGVTWAAFNGTVNNGINPNTSITSASTDVSGFNEYVSVTLTSATGAGTISGVLYGCRQPGCSTAGATVTIPTPVPVDGPTAAGSPPTTPPVLVAGQDSTPLIRTMRTDANGDVLVVGAQPANSTASWTDATPQDTVLAVSTVNQANVTFGLVKTGVITAGVVTFEGTTDGTTWVPVSVVSIGSTNSSSTSMTLATQSNNIWQMFIGGLTSFRLRLSTAITGAGATAAFTLVATTFGTELQQVVTQASGLNLHTNVDTLPGATTAQADAQTNSPVQPTATPSFTAIKQPTYPFKFNGATWDRDFTCPLSAPITFTAASGSLQIVAASGATIVRICHISISSSAASNWTIQYGTGANCGTGTAALTGAYNNVTTFALDFAGTLRTPASQALCLNSSVAVTAGGVVTYAQF
ncbi:MAG: hypothetical protein IVW54_16780 [Candidatus Binataceae bacterium]|nr:hypothetical protein [Candidatus Binataceae bacterium]